MFCLSTSRKCSLCLVMTRYMQQLSANRCTILHNKHTVSVNLHAATLEKCWNSAWNFPFSCLYCTVGIWLLIAGLHWRLAQCSCVGWKVTRLIDLALWHIRQCRKAESRYQLRLLGRPFVTTNQQWRDSLENKCTVLNSVDQFGLSETCTVKIKTLQ